MSGFYASNSRIQITDGNDVVFDTDTDMPHIVGTADVLGHTVSFSNMTQTKNYEYYDSCAYYVLGWVWEYQPVYEPAQWYYSPYYVYSTWTYQRVYSYYSGWTYQRVYTPGYTAYERVYVPGNFYYQRVYYQDYVCQGADFYRYSIDAREFSATQTLVSMPLDEDGDPIDVDFIIVRATGSRTLDGNDPRFSETFVSTIPTKSFSFQGSALLEASGRPDGTSWMRRIMSLLIDNATNTIKLRRQETVDTLHRETLDSPFGTSNASTFSFNFKIFFGRFKS